MIAFVLTTWLVSLALRLLWRLRWVVAAVAVPTLVLMAVGVAGMR